MAKTSSVEKNNRRRRMAEKYAARRAELRAGEARLFELEGHVAAVAG